MATANFTGNGTQTEFILPDAPLSVSSVTVDDALVAYSLSGALLTFGEAPVDGAVIAVDYTSKLEVLRVLCGLSAETMPDSSLTIYLGLAESLIMRRLYPFITDDFSGLEFPDKYGNLQVQIANEMVLRRGAEGETSHDEEGVRRGYENAGVSESLLKQIHPYARSL